MSVTISLYNVAIDRTAKHIMTASALSTYLSTRKVCDVVVADIAPSYQFGINLHDVTNDAAFNYAKISGDPDIYCFVDYTTSAFGREYGAENLYQFTIDIPHTYHIVADELIERPTSRLYQSHLYLDTLPSGRVSFYPEDLTVESDGAQPSGVIYSLLANNTNRGYYQLFVSYTIRNSAGYSMLYNFVEESAKPYADVVKDFVNTTAILENIVHAYGNPDNPTVITYPVTDVTLNAIYVLPTSWYSPTAPSSYSEWLFVDWDGITRARFLTVGNIDKDVLLSPYAGNVQKDFPANKPIYVGNRAANALLRPICSNSWTANQPIFAHISFHDTSESMSVLLTVCNNTIDISGSVSVDTRITDQTADRLSAINRKSADISTALGVGAALATGITSAISGNVLGVVGAAGAIYQTAQRSEANQITSRANMTNFDGDFFIGVIPPMPFFEAGTPVRDSVAYIQLGVSHRADEEIARMGYTAKEPAETSEFTSISRPSIFVADHNFTFYRGDIKLVGYVSYVYDSPALEMFRLQHRSDIETLLSNGVTIWYDGSSYMTTETRTTIP